MDITNINLGACPLQYLSVGYVGETGARPVSFNFSAWATEYGAGVLQLLLQRPGDAEPYPVLLDLSGTTATWTPDATATEKTGQGQAQLIYTVGGVVVKNAIFRVLIAPSLGAAGDPPEPYEDWLEQLTELAAETQQSAIDAAGSAEAAGTSAGAAAGSAGAAAQSALDAEAAKSGAEAAETAAGQSATLAGKKAAEAAQAAQTAAQEADYAQHQSTMAADSAEAAYENAERAAQSAEDAQAAASAAQTAATAAGAAAADAAATVTEVETKGAEQITAINQAGTTQIAAVDAAGAAQVQAIEDKGEEVIASIPSDYTELADEVSDLKSSLSNVEKGNYDLGSWIPNTYIQANGNANSYTGWKATNFVQVPTSDSLYIIATASSQGSHNCFYNASKQKTGDAFSFSSGENSIAIPSGAAYFRLSMPDSVNVQVQTVIGNKVEKNTANILKLNNAFEIYNEVLETAFATEYETSITLTEAKTINDDGTLNDSSNSTFRHSKLLAVKPGKTYTYSFECGALNFNFRVLGYTSEATDTEYSTAPFVKMLDFQVPTVNSVNSGTFVVDDPNIAYVRFSGRASPTDFMIDGKIDCMGDFLGGSVSDMVSNAISEDYASASLWEQGTYNGQTPGPSTIRLRTIDYFTADVFPSVHVLSGYEILIIAWNKTTGAYVGTWGANGTAFVTEGASTYVLDFDFTRFPDYKFKACLRNKNNTRATIIPAEGLNAVFRKIKFATTGSEIHSHASYTRLYSDITSELVWQNKTITTEGISDSSTEVIAQLPSSGNVEIRMRRNTEDSQFSVWQKVGNTITMMCDWTHYQYRYTGDYSPEYYVRVKTEATSNRDFVLKHCTVTYKYCDQGENKNKQTRMFGKKVAVFGDSIVQGKVRKNQASDVNSLTCKPWSSLIGEVNGDFNPHNFGIGGATVANTGTTTYPDWKSLYTRRNEITGFDIVIICAGINDYGAAVTEPDFRTAYAAVLDALIANNTQVVVATLCARSTNTANSAGLRPSNYAAIEKEIATAKSLTVIDLYAGTDNAEYKAQLPDGLHPNEIGHQIIANLVLSGY